MLDGPQQIELPPAEGRGLRHGRERRDVDPQHHAGGFEAQEEIVERLGRRRCLHGVGGQTERHDRIGLDPARSSIHGSRGRTHMMRSGGTPFVNNHTIASVAVLPEPTITHVLGEVARRTAR